MYSLGIALIIVKEASLFSWESVANLSIEKLIKLEINIIPQIDLCHSGI